MLQKTKYRYPVLLLVLLALLTAILWPCGSYFGSEVDWYSQHIALAETIRTACLEQHTAAPAFLPLGGGSNGFQFAYYGYFRPDILLGCLLPGVSMLLLVPLYLLLGYGAATLLCYALLRAHGLEPFWAFWGSVLFFSASCFFHLHRQIMFVNFLPFLLAALLSIRRGRAWSLPLWIFLICLHSFYYAPACILVAGWFWYQQEGSLRFWKKYLGAAALGTGLAAMLLLPAGLAILEHRRTSTGSSLLQILLPNLSMKGLLYSAYGIGLTAVCLYALLLGLTHRRFRRDSVVYLVVTVWNLAPYLLNGTLYTRPKILIPLLPLLVLHTTRVLRALCQKQLRVRLWPCPVLLAALLPYWNADQLPWLVADVLLVACFAACAKYIRRPGVYTLLLVSPCLLFLQTAKGEDFAAYREAPAFPESAYQTVYQDTRYRFDSLDAPLDACNRLDFAGQKKSTMYSSVTNEAYNTVFFDVLQTPIRVNNRTAMVAESNPFALRLLGVRYLQTTASKVPAGYTVVCQSGKRVLAENPDVLPIAYATANLMGQAQFDELTPAEQLAAMTTHTIVAEAETRALSSPIHAFQPAFSTVSLPATVQVTREENGYRLRVAEDSTLSLPLQRPLDGQILLLDFMVDNHTRRAVEITVNGIRNRLSNAAAPYPNGNNHFRYPISADGSIERLTVTLAKGDYTIRDIGWQTCPLSLLTEQSTCALSAQALQKGEIVSGRVTLSEDGYLVTSVPRQNGMRLFIDGKETALETVNLAFVGAPLSAGEHTVRLTFAPPGQKAGYGVSLVCCALFAWLCYKRRRKKNATKI